MGISSGKRVFDTLQTKEQSSRGLGRFKRVFSIFFASYLLTLLLPCAGILYLYHQIEEMTERNCTRDAITTINDVSADLRARIAWMDNAAARLHMDTSTTSMLFAPRLTYGDTRINNINAYTRHLNDLLGAYDQESPGYRLLFQNSEMVFDEASLAQGLEFVFNTALTYDGMTFAQWHDTVFASNEKSFLPVHTIRLGDSCIRALTYNFPIVRRTSQDTYRAVLQFFIPEETLIPDHVATGSSVYLIDNRNAALFAHGAQPEVPAPLAAQSGTGWLRHQGGLLAYTEVSHGLKMAMLIPEDVAFRDVLAMRGPLITVFLLFAILEGFLSWYLARRNARPIESLASNMTQMLNTPRQTNELEYLHQSMLQLQQDHQTAQQAVERSRQVETALLLNRLLYYRVEEVEEHLTKGDQIGIDLRAQTYCVAVAALPAHGELRANAPVPPLPQELRVIISEGQRSSLNILYLADTPACDTLSEAIQAHLQKLLPYLPQGTRLGLGRLCDSLQDAAYSYNQAAYCLQLDPPQDGLVVYDQVSPVFNSLYFPLDQQQRILNAVKHSNLAVIDQEFDLLLNENAVKRHLSALLKRTLLSSVEALLLMAAEDAAQEENLSDYLRSVQQSSDFRTELEILRGEFKKIATQVGERHTSHASSLQQEMQDYLDQNHSDSMLSIGSMAEHFGFSESYFSVLFKDLMGEPYSICLEKLRLNRAGELLKTTDISIEDVAQQVGYNNSTTFRRAFKRVKGISPAQFRSQ